LINVSAVYTLPPTTATEGFMTAVVSGLEGVVVAETAMSRVDGEAGRLVIRGKDVGELAGAHAFAEVCALMWTGETTGLPGVAAGLAAARVDAWRSLPQLGAALEATDAMDALRAGLSHVSSQGSPEAVRVRVVGAVPVFAAAWWRLSQGLDPVAPDPALGHAADYLAMLTGETPQSARVTALETYLATVVDHGMNASTFTARVVASTASDLVSATVAALGALKGPLHGGAPGPVLDMLEAIGEPARARTWLEGELAAGRRIMGMGHRVYKVRDPRAAVLETAVAALERAGVARERLALARAVEREATTLLNARKPGRRIFANVEFMTAVLLDAIGIDRRLFTPTFACARAVGWLAHAEEQARTGRLIRPRARYVGPAPDARCAPSRVEA
jgi:citrate synthase